MSELSEKCGLVTGAARGIGRAIALRLARAGASLTLCDMDPAGLAETADLVRALGVEVDTGLCDVTDENAVRGLVEAAVQRWGALHIACNNAARSAGEGPLHGFARERFDATLDGCLTSVWLCMKHQAAAMLGAGGAIVNISSNAALRGHAFNAPYAAAKSGVNSLTQSAAAEYGRRGIRVNAVSPGVIRTPGLEKLFEENPKVKEQLSQVAVMGRLGEPEEIANTVAFLLSDQASFITGQILSVDGGAAVR